ncbi:Uncharacterised protein [Mycoplasmopsis bovigenitalium]|uniref:Uncharacterized protein n=1 Tax=Mycoplasmopsis bovigenitalium TaxID=2112 RepID=A0A449A921_9BACT|nr:hypothetical protein [Mycoplasmopsis bovigenitalium]VEU60767.1 Uncharacterised protein [Mycoplasmopsis bovigenitalium]
MSYKPINNTSTIEIVKSNSDSAIEDKKIAKDPQNQISPRVWRVIRTERNIKIINLTISYTLMMASLLIVILASLKIGVFANGSVGYIILCSIVAFLFFTFGTINTIENAQWKNTIKKYREALNSGDNTSSSTFHLAYRRIVLKGVNLTWALIFVLTYVGLFTAIVYGLYKTNVIKVEYEPNFKMILELRKWLDQAFVNTGLLCLLLTIAMVALIVFYIIMCLIDKKRLADLDDFLGEKSVEIHEQINKAKKDRNKALMITYFVVVAVTILIPLTLVIFAIWRLIRKKRAKISAI